MKVPGSAWASKVTLIVGALAVFSSGASGGTSEIDGVPLGKVARELRKVGAEAKAKPATAEPKSGRAAVSRYTGPKKRLGIMDMEVKVTATSAMQPMSNGGMTQTTTISIPPPTDFGTGLTEMLTTALVDSGRFICLERKAMMDIQGEQALMSGPLADAASAPGMGRLLGAQALIRGAVTEYSYNASSTGGSASFLKGIGLAASRAEAVVALDIRIYDAATGVIIDSVRGEGRASASAVGVTVDKPEWQMSTSGFKQTPLGHATRQAIEQAVALICDRMATMPWEGRIADIEEESVPQPTVYINAGSKVGLKEGDTLRILRPGRTIVDPETRTVIGRTKDAVLGNCRLTSVNEGVSVAEATDGQGFKIGDVVRFVDPVDGQEQGEGPGGSGTETPR